MFEIGITEISFEIEIMDIKFNQRLPSCLQDVLPSFENSLILLSINNGIMAFQKLGNTASKQPGSLWFFHPQLIGITGLRQFLNRDYGITPVFKLGLRDHRTPPMGPLQSLHVSA